MQFGKHMLSHWGFDPEVIYLNHGTVGAPPKRVLAKQQQIREQIERQPSKFMLRDFGQHAGMPTSATTLIRQAAQAMAEFLNVNRDDLVFVDNITTGANAVLRSQKFKPGDVILVTDLAYGAITNAARYVAREQGAEVRTVTMPYPATASEMADAIINAIDSRTVLAIVDHITSESALILPIAEITKRCHEKGVKVLVDGAHAPGAIPLDVASIGADWYTGNFHKWAWAPRSCGFLWASPENQKGLHPVVISWGLDQGLVAEFDWVGTRDPSPFLAAPEGVAFMRELGMDAIRAYNHDLIWKGTQLICDRVGTKFEIPETMIGSMATLPLPQKLGSTKEDAARLRDKILFEDNIEISLHMFRDRPWMRVSAQIYNDMNDFERLAAAIQKRI